MDIINSNIEENFWVLNPQFKYHSYFKEIYDSDKSKGKNNSSRLMWAVMLWCDPIRSQFFSMPEELRQEEIHTNYLNKLVPWEEVVKHTEAWREFAMIPLEKQLLRVMKKLEDREKFLAETTYNTRNIKTLDTAIITTKELWKTVETLQSQLKGLQESGTPWGGGTLSAADQRKF